MSAQPQCHRAGCRRSVIWAVTLPGGQPIALDSEPTEAGVYAVDFDAMPHITARRKRRGDEPIHFHGPLYTPHVETCRSREESTTDRSVSTTARSVVGSGR